MCAVELRTTFLNNRSMSQARLTKRPSLRNRNLREVVSGLHKKTESAGENLVEFIKTLEKIEATPEKIAFNSKYYRAPDNTVIEY